MPNGQTSFNPNAPYQKPQQGFDPNAPYQSSAAAPVAAQPKVRPSLMDRVKNWWEAPKPLVLPGLATTGRIGAPDVPILGTDVSPKEHISRAAGDAALVSGVGAPLEEIAAGRSLMPILKTVGRGLVGSGVGAAGGSWLGGYAGEALKNRQLGEEIGGTLGGLAGGIYGGLDRPVFGPWGSRYSVGRMLPSLARVPELADQEKLGAFMNRGYQSAMPNLRAQEEARAAFMNKGYLPAAPEETPFTPFKPSESIARNIRGYGSPEPEYGPAAMPIIRRPASLVPPAEPETFKPFKPSERVAKQMRYGGPNNEESGGYSAGGGPAGRAVGAGEKVGKVKVYGREGSAGDLTGWKADDLWSQYMKNRGNSMGYSIAKELERRGLVKGVQESIR